MTIRATTQTAIQIQPPIVIPNAPDIIVPSPVCAAVTQLPR
jgi:hypothetical protein